MSIVPKFIHEHKYCFIQCPPDQCDCKNGNRLAWELQPITRCAAARDGDCTHAQCPQLRDNEPRATGRHCPLDVRDDDE